jgi:hypothetical protein
MGRGRVVRSYDPGSDSRGPAVLTLMCVQADLNHCPRCKVLRTVQCPLLAYNNVLGGLEELSTASRIRVGRGIVGSPEIRSGVCRCLLAPYEVFLSSPEPPDQSGHYSEVAVCPLSKPHS